MSRRKAVFRRWREFSITSKFTIAFGALLALLALITITSYVVLTVVRLETDTAIITSTKIQRLVLEMDRDLETARHLEKDFFLRYPILGYTVAYQKYVRLVEERMIQIRAHNAELQQLISESDMNDVWRKSDVRMHLYLSAVKRYASTVEEAAELVAKLVADAADSGTGLQVQLVENLSSLQDELQLANDPSLMVLYHKVRSFQKDYLIARQRPLMQSAFNATIPLREAIELVPVFEADQKALVLRYLENYLITANEVLEIDAAIRHKLKEFDLQAEAIDPISEELIELASQEVERARAQLGQTNQLVMVILAITGLAGLALVLLIARLLNYSITSNVVKLTEAASELQAGNLGVRTDVDSGDELGELSDSFNAMASRIDSLVGDLEKKVAERTVKLTAVNEQLEEEIIERRRTEQALQEKTNALGERVKELSCFYNITGLVATPDITLEAIIQGVVEIIPPAWQYPDVTCSRIILKGQEYKSKRFAETIWKQSSGLFVYGEQVGTIETYYLEEKPEIDEDLFLKNERSLLNAISERLGHTIERKQSEEELKKHREHLEELVEERTADLQKVINAMAGREVRMADLKQEIKSLKEQLNEVADR